MSPIPGVLWEGGEAARQELESLARFVGGLLPFELPWGGNRQADEQQAQQKSQARALERGLEAVGIVDGVQLWRHRLLGPMSVLQFGGIVSAAAAAMSPQGPGCCDFNGRERVANVLTSLPYAAIGLHSLKHRRTASGKAWGASMLGVCGASITFHVSSGKWRDLGRKLDYWTIAVSSGLLTRALYPHMHPAVTAASFTLTPFKPFLVSTGNAMAMEAKFLHRAFQSPDLRGAQKLHSAACVAGMAVFAAEDASVPHVPLVHATWHCLSALSTAMINHCLADAEAQFPQYNLDYEGADGHGWRQSHPRKPQHAPQLDVAPLGLDPA